jgi:hypothetical protein
MVHTENDTVQYSIADYQEHQVDNQTGHPNQDLLRQGANGLEYIQPLSLMPEDRLKNR